MPPASSTDHRFGYFLSTILEVAELSPDLRDEYARKLEAQGYTSLKLVMKLDETKLSQCGVRTAHCHAIAEAVQAFRDFGYSTFVSHNKENAGSEAAMIGDFFRVKFGPDRRAFVDTDDLKKLSDIVLAAEMSETCVVLLSEKYCKSAFCLIEAIKCFQTKKKIATVTIIRPSLERFDFAAMSKGLDDDRFVKALLPEKGWQCLREHSLDLHDVKKTLRHLLDIRAHEFSPHAPLAVRTAQLSEVFKSLGFESASTKTTTRMTLAQQKVFISDLDSAVQALSNPQTVVQACDFLYDATGGDSFDEDDKWKRTRVVSAGGDKACVTALRLLSKSTQAVSASRTLSYDPLVKVLHVVRNLARDYEHAVLLFNQGLCELVVDTMMKFNRTSEQVALWGCRILANLAVNDFIRAHMLLKIGAQGACLEAAKTHFMESLDICESACNAFRALAVTDEDKRQLSNGGVPLLLVQICKSKGPANARVAEKSCAAIRNLATVKENSQIFHQLHAEQAVLACLKQHLLEDVAVCDKACGAIANLAASDENLRAMVGSGALDFGRTVVRALETHGLQVNDPTSAAFSEEALGAVQMAVDRALRDSLEGVVPIVVQAMYCNGSTDFRVAERGSAAVRNLALSESISVELCKQGILPVLVACLQEHTAVPSVVEQIFGALWGLSNSCLNDEIMYTQNIPVAVLNALKLHVASAKVCRKGCGALRNLTASAKGAAVLSQHGCNALLMEILRTHAMKDVRIAEEACGALKNISALVVTTPQNQTGGGAHKIDPKQAVVLKKKG